MNSQVQDLSTRDLDFDSEVANFTDKHPRQLEALKHLDSGEIKFLLYGGALGGGKSYLLRWYGVRRLIILARWGFTNPVGMLACEDYPSLKDRQLQKIGREFPPWLGTMHADHKEYGRSFIVNPKWGGGVLCFRNLDDPSKYASAEFAFILVDELTKNQYDVFTHLRTRLRWPGLPDIEAQFVGGTNPGNVGHGWVKQLWMDKNFPEEWIEPVDYRPQFAFVPSKADDNPYLTPEYWSMLNTLPLTLRKAFREGDWAIFVGQAFPEFSEQTHKLKDSPPVPEAAQLYMTYDWGWGKPFSIGWWWVDSDGRILRFAEWYGWTGTGDEGLRMPDSQVAEGIVEKEKTLKIDGRQILRLSGSDCFAKRPDIYGGGQGPPTAEIFAKQGLYLSPGDDRKREVKIRAFRERLRDWPDVGPMLMVYPECTEFIRTIPNLVMDDHRIEDVNSKGEDHVYDEACHICMARPIAMDLPKPKLSSYDRRIERLLKPDDHSYEDYALREQQAAFKELGLDRHDYGEMGQYEDGELVGTVE